MRAVALMTLSAFSTSCSRSREFNELSLGDRSHEKKGCPSTFGYEPPIFTQRTGLESRSRARRHWSGGPVFGYETGYGGTLIDDGGGVYRYCGAVSDKKNHALAGYIDPTVMSRMLSFREAAVAAPLQWFPPPGSDDDGGGVIRLYDPAQPHERQTELARSGPKTLRRVSPEADLLIRWIIAVHQEVQRIPFIDFECWAPEK